jgi:Na+-translocating ferredoxin:NAD+ oxidoreductase RnfD subunit
VLAALTVAAAPREGWSLVTPVLTAGIGAAALVDVLALRWRTGTWAFPSGAILTGWIAAMVMSAHEPPWVVAVTAVIGVLSKYVVRGRTANVFNPAAVAIVVTFYLFGTGQSWWGALPDAPTWTLVLLVGTGAFITDRVNKFPLVLAFLGAFYLLATASAFAGNAAGVAEVYRTPDVQAALFFACFILTDPPTSPTRYRAQVICGVLVGITAFAVYESIGAVFYLLAGVLVGNVWEAWNRQRG